MPAILIPLQKQIIGVEGNRLILGGADIVDGSPVLDVKPYVPFCDSLPAAAAPPWVAAEADDEPLRLSRVVVPPAVEAQVARVWAARRSASVFDSADGALQLIREVLSRDIRSLNQRLRIHPVGSKAEQQQQQQRDEDEAAAAVAAADAEAAAAAAAAAANGVCSSSSSSSSANGGGAAGGAPQQQQKQQQAPPPRGRYIVVLDGMDVTYDLTPDGTVLLRGVYPLGGGVDGGEALAAEAAAAAERVGAAATV